MEQSVITLDGKNSQYRRNSGDRYPLIPLMSLACPHIGTKPKRNSEDYSITPCLWGQRACPLTVSVSPKTHLARAYMCIIYVLVTPVGSRG